MAIGSFGDPFMNTTLSAYVSGNPFAPTGYMGVFVTADGAVKLQQMQAIDQRVVFACERRLTMNERFKEGADPQMNTQIMRRTYELYERSGPGGTILEYREVIE